MKTSEFEQAIAYDPSTSYWLKEQLDVTKQRDPVDALNDAEALVTALKARLTLLTEASSP
ncbi:hypothetical protein IC617_08455 [Neiella sp. HB171785]|uniref:Uncharacterized protein n=1 Tax=Neiella litorisoli TaxID=2771431 RepID=A0A8J6QJT6_9GAMM|nr:hypothetical protein [Neiella litorisoli]MBD1389456.1 hypothetical protein [Neiella litorisoli]